jgi:hypothetical protein
MVQADKHSVTYNTILDRACIEQELFRYNRTWLRQAADMPFGHGELFTLLGYDGITAEADAIVSGTCIPYTGFPLSRELQIFLEECRRPESVKEISSFTTLTISKRR